MGVVGLRIARRAKVPGNTPHVSSTRPSPLYRTASDEKLGVGLGTRLLATCTTIMGSMKNSSVKVNKKTNFISECFMYIYYRASYRYEILAFCRGLKA